MTIKDVSTMNQEIGVIQGVALGMSNQNATAALMDAAEVLEGIAYKLMREVVGDDLMERMEDDGA